MLHAIVLVLHRGGGEGVGLVLLLLLLLLAVACMWEVIALRNLRKCRLLLLLLPAHQSHLNRGVVEGVTRGARQKRLCARVA